MIFNKQYEGFFGVTEELFDAYDTTYQHFEISYSLKEDLKILCGKAKMLLESEGVNIEPYELELLSKYISQSYAINRGSNKLCYYLVDNQKIAEVSISNNCNKKRQDCYGIHFNIDCLSNSRFWPGEIKQVDSLEKGEELLKRCKYPPVWRTWEDNEFSEEDLQKALNDPEHYHKVSIYYDYDIEYNLDSVMKLLKSGELPAVKLGDLPSGTIVKPHICSNGDPNSKLDKNALPSASFTKEFCSLLLVTPKGFKSKHDIALGYYYECRACGLTEPSVIHCSDITIAKEDILLTADDILGTINNDATEALFDKTCKKYMSLRLKDLHVYMNNSTDLNKMFDNILPGLVLMHIFPRQ